MGCIISSVACCCCSAAASLCCSCLPSCKNSTSSRIMFSLILVITTLLSAIALLPQVRTALTKIPALCTPFKLYNIETSTPSGIDCDAITGFGAVYRLCFATAIFYLLFLILMIRVQSSKDPRSKIQNGFWFFKYLIWFGLMVGAFFIPVEGFTTSWMIFGMIGGALYILVQLVLLVDFAHSWNEGWIAKWEDTGEKIYAVGLAAFTLLFYIISAVGIGLLYHFYAKADECSVNKAMLSLNLIFIVGVSVVSVLPRVHERLPSSGLLQSSLISCYVIFLTWSSMTNGKDPTCNPSMAFQPVLNSTTTNESVALKFDWQIALGLLILILSVLYSSLRSSSHTALGKLGMSGPESVALNDVGPGLRSGSEETNQLVWDDEEDKVTYVYSMFHFMLLLATLYVMVMLTNWLKPENDLKSLSANIASYWVRMVSSWVCLLLYLWTMVAPILFPDREF